MSRVGGVRFGDRMASFHGQPIVPAVNQEPPFWRRNPAFNQLYCSVYHLNHATLPAYIDELAKFDPEVVVGYTSAVHRVATHLIETGQIGRLRPRSVLVSSEALRPAARADMELAFGCTGSNSYSLGELVAYVSQCPEGDLHVTTEYGVIELLDLDGHGATEIVATGLINKGMPLLRYRTGDLATAAEPGTAQCGRGLPTLADLVGRIDDVVHTPEGAVVGPAPMSLAFQRVPNLRRAQVRQDSPDALEVLIETADRLGSRRPPPSSSRSSGSGSVNGSCCASSRSTNSRVPAGARSVSWCPRSAASADEARRSAVEGLASRADTGHRVRRHPRRTPARHAGEPERDPGAPLRERRATGAAHLGRVCGPPCAPCTRSCRSWPGGTST